jgi:hypothetical protein
MGPVVRALALLSFAAFAACSLPLAGSAPTDDGVATGKPAAKSTAGATGDTTPSMDASVTDGSVPLTASSDAAPIDAAPVVVDAGAPPDSGCPSAVCNGVCVPGGDCSLCGDNIMRCAGTNVCVNDCALCGAGLFACFTCGANGNPAGRCMPEATATCFDGPPPVGRRCDCNVATDCPGDTDVCLDNVCLPCGAPRTNGVACKQNKCDQVGRACDQ